MAALGDAFRTAREAQGLTLSDVAQRTHIRSAYLAAIESEDWKVIGPPVYIRGFLRSYARCLGLDGDAAAAAFSGEPASKPPAAPLYGPAPRTQAARAQAARSELPGPSFSATEKPKKGPSAGAIAGLVIALGLVLFVAYQYFDYKLNEPVTLTDGRSVPASDASAPAPQPTGPKPELERLTSVSTVEMGAARTVEERANGFALRLADSSWLRVVVDGKVAMEGIYPKGTERTFSGRSATVRTGNAGGVDVSVDGKDLGPMGGLGDVAERSFQL